MSEQVSFRKSGIVGTVLILLVLALVAGSLPVENLTLLIINLSLLVCITIALFIVWIKYRTDKKRHLMIHGYFFVKGFALFTCIPFLRIIYGHYFFWIAILLVLTVIVLSYIFVEKIIFSIRNPHKSLFGKIFITLMVLVMIFGNNLYERTLRPSLVEQYDSPISILFFVVSIFFFILNPGLLLEPSRIERIVKKGKSA